MTGPVAGAPALRCIDCAGPLAAAAADDALACGSCGRAFAVVAGIPDLRPPLEGFDVEADRALALELAERRGRLDFAGLLRHYWAAQPDVDPGRVERFVRGDLIGAARAEQVADQIEALAGPVAGRAVLELGSGTAALGSVLATRTAPVVVTDVALAWLVLARHRLAEAGLDDVTVVACTADHLPFAPASFDLVVAADVIEHVPDADAMAASAYAALAPGGSLWLSTPNRFSLTPEPHVRLWGVGLLPRRAALAYVRRFRGTDYASIHTLSLFRLRDTLTATGGEVRVVAPAITGPVRSGYGRAGRALIDLYDVSRRLPVAAAAVLAVSPLFHAVLHKPSGVIRARATRPRLPCMPRRAARQGAARSGGRAPV